MRSFLIILLIGLVACNSNQTSTVAPQSVKIVKPAKSLQEEDFVGRWVFYWDEKLKSPADTLTFLSNGQMLYTRPTSSIDKPTDYKFIAKSKELHMTEYKRGRINKELYKAEWHDVGVIKISTFYPGDHGAGFYLKRL